MTSDTTSGPGSDAARRALPVVCIHDDRPENAVGIVLAVLSCARHAPGFEVIVSAPGATHAFRDWLASQPNARPMASEPTAGEGWNAKPALLLALLDAHPAVVWLDSDIVLTADVTRFFTGLDDAVLVAAEEPYWGQEQGGTFRTVAWGLEPARRLTSTVNSGILRVTREHRPLLEAWRTMLGHATYRAAQAKPWYERPLHMVGDQEALTGLLASSDFSHVPVVQLRRGHDIAQCFGPAGFTPLERLRSLRSGDPPFVHAMGPKPWIDPPAASGARPSWTDRLRRRYRGLSLELSPYCPAVRAYVAQLGVELAWSRPRSRLGRLLAATGGRRAAAMGWPLAIVDHGARWIRRRLGVARYRTSNDFVLRERPF